MVSLMEDQIIQMNKLNINAKMICSHSSKEESKLLYQVFILHVVSLLLYYKILTNNYNMWFIIILDDD